jgi:hypothetical protein
VPDYGFGFRPFGEEPFGDPDWCRIVLWEELPPNMQEDDEAQGYPFRTFVYSMCPSFEWLRHHIDRFEDLTNPFKVRKDLLTYLAANFGIELDLAEPEDFQRIRVSLAARWNIIKGTVEAYEVLCRVHGFEVTVIPLWWNGTEYTESGPSIYNEAITYTAVVNGPNTDFTFRFAGAPIVPGTLVVFVPNAPDVTLTETGGEVFTGYPNSFIDYGWGYATVTLSGTSYGAPLASYDSVAGGNPEDLVKTKTHRLRLRIVPGTIGGQSELTISEAFQRLYVKLGEATGNGVVPVHVELEPFLVAGSTVVSFGNQYDTLGGDQFTPDEGLNWVIV